MDRKSEILDALDVLRRSELLNKADPTARFKAAAYLKVYKAIKDIPSITSYDDLKDIKGIGTEIRAKIKDVLATGKSASAEKARTESVEVADQLLKIYGVGPVKASELIKAGIRSLDDLRKHPELLNENQKLGLKYYNDINKRIPREEIDIHRQDIWDSVEGDLTIEIAGSYRRGAPNSGDIDVLVTGEHYDFEDLLDKLYDDGYILAFLSRGKKKALTIAHLPGKPARRVDFQYTTPEEFPFAVLYFTGSDQFNIGMRKYALSNGYSLSEHGLKKINEDVPDVPLIKKEEDIFKFLDFKYVHPTER